MSLNSEPLIKAQQAHRSGKVAEAESAYDGWLRLYPDEPNGLHFLGVLKFQTGRTQDGLDLVRRSLQFDEKNAHAWNNLGNMLVATDKPKEAAEAYCKATDISPTLAEAWYNLGICYRRTREIEKAVASFCKAIELEPAKSVVYERFGILLYGLGRFAEAADVYRQWLAVEPDNPVARHMLAAMTGQDVPDRADDKYLKVLFDSFSSSFDKNLASLGYRAPELLVSALGDYVPSDGRLEILDAGCGTGLCGPLLRSLSRRLVGVDLSDGMVEKARVREVYDELVVGELCAFMRDRPNTFDVVLSADTLVYFGALNEVSAAAKTCIRSGGILTFTLERLETEDDVAYRIQPHGRYAHRRDYVEQTLKAAGFAHVDFKEVVLRRERGTDVGGHLVVAH